MRDDEEPITQEGKPDLATVTTEELIRELMDRHAALVMSRVAKNEPDAILRDWNGGLATCIGLANRLHYCLLNLGEAKPEEQT